MRNNAFVVTTTGANSATGAASAGGALPIGSSGSIPRYIRVAATQPAYFRIGVGAQTAIATDMLINPGDAVFIGVPQGVTNYACLQVTTAGVLVVTPAEDC